METTTVRRLSLVQFACGLWILSAPTSRHAAPPVAWSGLLAGGVVVALATYAYVMTSGESVLRPGAAAVAAVAGGWAAVAPALLGASDFLVWSVGLAGVVVAAAATYSGYWAGAAWPGRGARAN